MVTLERHKYHCLPMVFEAWPLCGPNTDTQLLILRYTTARPRKATPSESIAFLAAYGVRLMFLSL